MLKKLMCLGLALFALVAFAACGSDSDTSESTDSPAASGDSTSEGSTDEKGYVELMGDSKYSTPTLVSAAQGEEEGEAFANPEPAKLPKLKVGFINFAKAAESGVRSEYEFVEPAKVLGWDVVTCDGGGIPTGYTNCMNTLINEDVEAIYTTAIEPSVIAAQIKQAKAKGIVVVSGNAKVKMGDYDGAFFPTEEKGAELGAEFLEEKLAEVEGPKEIAIHTFPAGFAEQRANGIFKAVEDNPDYEIVAEAPVEAADAVGSTKKATETEITQYPELSAIVDPFDSAIAGTAQAVATKMPGKAFPEAPLVMGWNALLGSQAYMRQDPPLIAGLIDTDYGACGWIALDQLAQFFARDTPISQEPEPDYGIDYLSTQLVTPEDLLEEERYPPNKSNYWAFFKGKWKKEFGIG